MATGSLGERVQAMEGELGRPSRGSSEGADCRGFGSPTWASPLGKLLDSPPSCASDGCGGGDGGSGFSSPTWGSPLGTLFYSPSLRVDGRGGENGGSGFASPTWGSPLETLFSSPSSCVSDGRGGGNGGSGFSSPTWGSPLETLFNSPSSCVSDGRGGGDGSGFSSPTSGPHLGTLFNSPSSCASDSRGGGNSSSLGVLKGRDSEVQEAEMVLRAITKRYDDSSLRLRNATAELADLRRERVRLGAENLRLSLLIEELEAAEQIKQASAVAPTPPPKPAQAEAASGCTPKSTSMRSKGFLSPKQPQGGATPQHLRVGASQAVEEPGEKKEKADGEAEVEAYRQGTAKSVSIRSKGFLSPKQSQDGVTPQRLRVRASPAVEEPGEKKKADGETEVEAYRQGAAKSVSIRSKGFFSPKQSQGGVTPQRLRVRASPAVEEAGEKKKADVEVEAYRQGAKKTELCNKWERGACPYDGRCRFAHGMQELRPVIRHPRYKTLPCQLFAAGSGCPYGHRCHFRHSLPPTAKSC